jgi:hypothetical protein
VNLTLCSFANLTVSIPFVFLCNQEVQLGVTRNALTKHFKPNYIEFNHITRDEIIQNYTRHLRKTLFGGPEDPAILVLDGAYFYFQKSSSLNFIGNVTISIKTGHW